MAANYYCLLLDLDGTLFDFAAAEREAVSGTLAEFGLPDGDETVERYTKINAALWAQLEQGGIKKDRLVVQRFETLLAELSAQGDAIKMNIDYMTRLSAAAPLFPGAKELLEELAEFATLAVASNGNYRVQMNRLEKCGLLPFFDEVFVSEKLGVTKPSPRFFDLAIKKLGVRNREKVLVVGDSLTADIKGGNAAKLDTCWCNFSKADNATDITPTHTVSSYTELKLVAVGEEALALAANREKRHMA